MVTLGDDAFCNKKLFKGSVLQKAKKISKCCNFDDKNGLRKRGGRYNC